MPDTMPNIQPVQIDGPISHGGIVVGSLYDYLVEQGNLYHVSTEWQTIQDSEGDYILIRPSTIADCHIVMDFGATGDFAIGLHEAPTLGDWGTRISAHPMNRTILREADTYFYRTAREEVDSEGVRLVSLQTATRRTETGQVCIGHWVFKHGVNYLVTLTNNSGAAGSACFVATFYEHTVDE